MFAFTVPDMTCGHCVKTITQALAALDRGARVSTDLQRKLVTVDTAAVTPEQCLAAITAAGYSPVAAG